MNLTNINNSKVFQIISDTVFCLQLKPSTTHFISHVWWTLSPSPRPTDWHTETFFFFKSSFLFSSLSTVITPCEQSLLLFCWARGRKGGSAHVKKEISGSNFRDCFKLLISRQQKMDQAPSKQYWCYSVTEERHMFYYRLFAKIRI